MLLWSLIDISNVAYQYQTIGFVTLPLLFITILHLVYTVDFFIYEKWYLRTMDIAHDHYGFYLAWGSTAWLPMMYSLQVQYAARHVNASHLSLPSVLYFLFVFILGLVAYAVFRDANNQKYDVRRFGGQCSVWGRPAEFITATYQTTDGTKHTSLLICSGWWGHARHANYTADLVLSTCMCALAGLTMNLIVWFYAIYMAVLLLHRVSRDEERCAAKYRSAWTDYCQRVPWRLVPGLY
ncbi:hypothetical protein diail_8714 [Diaporthe ilicicola]|nr:hypothetical protein diail_8714 [Diaporthe ilicicola]